MCLLVGQEGSASSQERLQQTREAFRDLGKVRVKVTKHVKKMGGQA